MCQDERIERAYAFYLWKIHSKEALTANKDYSPIDELYESYSTPWSYSLQTARRPSVSVTRRHTRKDELSSRMQALGCRLSKGWKSWRKSGWCGESWIYLSNSSQYIKREYK